VLASGELLVAHLGEQAHAADAADCSRAVRVRGALARRVPECLRAKA
jgi:hypothetical protein